MCADMSRENPGGDEGIVRGSGDSILSEDAELLYELEHRIAYITSPEYDDPSLRPLAAGDWALYIAAGIVMPIVLLVWGALQM